MSLSLDAGSSRNPRPRHRLPSRLGRRLLLAALVALLLAVVGPRGASAAPNDAEAEALIQNVLETEYFKTQFAEALEKLELAKQACSGGGCSPKVRAKIYVAIGTVLAGLKQPGEAKNAFASALKEDATAALFSDFITPDAQKAFNEARALSSASSGSTESNKQTKKRGPKKRYPGGGRIPKGWKSAEAAFYWGEAARSEQEREWLDCADNAQASLAAENRAGTRFLAATCEEKAGLWIEALADYRVVADTGGKTGLYDLETRAKSSVQQLTGKIPKVVLRKPAKATDLTITMNEQDIPAEKLDGEIWVNPGQRTVAAKGKIDGVELEFEQSIDANEGETVTIDVKLLPKGIKGRDTQIMKCMLAAATRDDFQKCLSTGTASKGTGLNVRIGSEFSGYHDTDHVDVVPPAFFASIESPTGGWGVSGSMLVDVVTAASVDVVANASPRWREVRYAPVLSGHKKFGNVDVSLAGSLSSEPDYLATTIGGGAAVDLANKTITPSLKYQLSYDVSGRSGTPFSVFSHTIIHHAIDASTTFVLNKSTILSASFTGVFETGDTSKPYRYVPLFSSDIVLAVPIGFAIDSVNAIRLPVRPLEQLPTNRQRYAIAGLLAHRFTSSTIRAEERLYSDSWGVKASTTSAQYFIDFTKELRVWPQVRFNAQSGASFWQLAYQGLVLSDTGSVTVPAIRTGNRELSPLVGVTGGFGVRYAFGEKRNWGLTVTGDVAYDKFFDALYILQRVGFLGATTLEVELD